MYDYSTSNALDDYTFEKNLLNIAIRKESLRRRPCRTCERNKDPELGRPPLCAKTCNNYKIYKRDLKKATGEMRAKFNKELILLAYEAEKEGYSID